MLEAVKRIGGDPPVRKGAGYNEVYTAAAGHLYFHEKQGHPCFFQFFFRKQLYTARMPVRHRIGRQIFHLHNILILGIMFECVNRLGNLLLQALELIERTEESNERI